MRFSVLYSFTRSMIAGPILVARAMAYDSRWSASARSYSQLYQRMLQLPPISTGSQ